ncbi:hypothetical protein [Mycobacterium xenopi]|uniref:hypothetical protein n=1 Tax=Mycobacterium xenopi TaxID=1789 RepID=UPI0022EB1844|nr:hypothetical protein [Mycobacterium xenopi]MDA3640013.1 hypothetical protein [Mycobacterium xenopi]
MTEDTPPSTAAEILAMAEQAEAEAAEAEALAAAARARARAIQLRRQAEAAAETSEASEPADAQTGTSIEVESASEPEAAHTEDSTADADAPAGDARQDKPGWFRRWRRRIRLSVAAAVLAAVVVVAALGGSVYMVLQHRNLAQQRERAAEFAAAARQGVVTLTSLDFNNAKHDVQRILDNSTGSFRDEFQKMADDFIKVVEQSKVVEKGTVQAVAVDLDSMTKDSATALVVSRSEVTNAAGAKEDPRNFRLVVTVARDGDQLKMSKVEFVP